ncbi:MAG: DUF2497 domain-containing protein [Marinomonas sp.]
MTQQNEASVEEILESIKQVIARDNREDAKETRRRRETRGVADTKKAAAEPVQDAVLETDASEEVLDLGEMEFAEDIDAPTEDSAEVAEPVVQSDDNAPLINDEARSSMRENLEALAMISQPSVPPQIVRSGETSLEGLARDLLRPMLSEWLDNNLPDMVETLVKEEIARIARKDRD